jgi:hypothetical protein
MDSKTDTTSVKNQKAIWAMTLAPCLSDFPAITHILETEGLAADPSALIAFIKGNQDGALYALLSSLNNTCAMAHDEATITQNQLHLANEQLREATEQVRSRTLLLDRLTERLADAPVPRVSDRRISRNPDPFSGDDKNIANRQETYATWKSQIRLNFAQDPNIFDTEKRRILHICGLLSGQAYQNNRDLLDTITKHPSDPTAWEWPTSEAALNALDKQYETLDLSLSASISFDKCFQKSRPFQNFLAEFTNLAKKCKKTEEQKVEALKKKVSESIAKALSTLDNPPARNDFTTWAAKCQIFYDNQQEYEHNYQSRTITRQLPAPTPTLTQPRSPAGDPMDLDLLNKMKAEERQRCYTNGLCFYCKAPGHDVDNCEKKKIADTRRSSGQTFRGRAGFRGRGAFIGRGAYISPAQPSLQYPRTPFNPGQAQQPPAFNRLRYLETGLVEGEVGSTVSTSPSESISQVNGQGKEQPLP